MKSTIPFLSFLCRAVFLALLLPLSLLFSNAQATLQDTESIAPLKKFRVAKPPYPLFDSQTEACAALESPCAQSPDPQGGWGSACSTNFQPDNSGPQLGCRFTSTWYDGKGELVQTIENQHTEGWIGVLQTCPDPSYAANPANGRCERQRPSTNGHTCQIGDPVKPGIGYQIETEVDFAGPAGNRMTITRKYSSFNIARQGGALGIGWLLFPFENRLVFQGTSTAEIHVVRGIDERAFVTNRGGNPNGPWLDSTATHLALFKTATGWKLTDASRMTVEEYDTTGRLLTIHYADGLIQTLRYSDASTPASNAPFPGMLAEVADNVGHGLAIDYGGTNRAVSITVDNSLVYQYGHNAQLGSLASVTYPDGKVRNYLYEESRGPARFTPTMEEASAGTGPHVPFDMGNFLANEQSLGPNETRGVVTSYAIDGLGNQTAQKSPDTGAQAATFDGAGNVKTVKDARGMTTTTTYDALNRVIREAYGGGTASTFEYDGGAVNIPAAIGRLSKMTDESGQTTYTFDAFGRLQTKTQTVGTGATAKTFVTGHTHGDGGASANKPTSITYPSGNRVNFAYGQSGRLSGLTLSPTRLTGGGTDGANDIVLLSNIGYTAWGAVRGWAWGNGAPNSPNSPNSARGHDADGRIVSYPLGDPSANGTTRTLHYDRAGRITGISHAGAPRLPI